ncbi:MAG TPA: hypothetical protein VFU40_01485 [Gemmatimonadales bacterium]|nr:hypothetical protein [Gemmatimonadales bacterium]
MLVLGVVLVDAVFIAIYFLGRLPHASDGAKAGFTLGWTLVTLLIVIRGLSRIRSARVKRKSA